MTTYVFPGQGSQSKGMGKDLFAEFPNYVEKANTILGFSIPDLCLDDPNNQLGQTNYTQPALYVVNALSYFKKIKEFNQKPDFVAGHSLGEYNALLAAEVFDFETGLKLVKKRSELMSQAQGGGMAAVIGLTSEVILSLLTEHHLSDIVIANYNSSTQTVISGPKNSILQAQTIFENAGAMYYVPLKVSGAFHSPFMNEAQAQFANFLKDFQFNPPAIPVIANTTAKPYEADAVAETLAKQINHSVCWLQSIMYLIENGEEVFEEIGPGKVLKGLINQIQKSLQS
jgi:polyketide biosynthesis malonyl-CoA-[acyl-carrier-protein] transacylase